MNINTLLRLQQLLAISILSVSPFAGNASEQLAVKYGCVACHATTYTRIGPPFEDIANRYRAAGDGAIEHLVRQIEQGSKGAWGEMPMAPQPLPTKAEKQELSRWILNTNSVK